jgi:hypothetical protein
VAGGFTTDEFVVDEAASTVTCPAAAAILGRLGDPTRFTSLAGVRAFTGLVPTLDASGLTGRAARHRTERNCGLRGSQGTGSSGHNNGVVIRSGLLPAPWRLPGPDLLSPAGDDELTDNKIHR